MAEFVYNPFTNRLDAVNSSSVPIDVADGGTGSTSFNINGVVISGTTTTSPLTSLTLTNGQIVIGATGLPPAAASLIAGSNITITPGANSITISATGTGDVVGPAGATDEAIARFDTATGKLIQNSVVLINDAGAITGATGVSVTGPSTFNGAQIVKRTVPGAYPYDVLTTDYIVEVDTSSARTIRLPDAPSTGQVFFIKDVTGSAAGNNITIQAFSGVVTIDGAITTTINVSYGSDMLYFNGTSYFII